MAGGFRRGNVKEGKKESHSQSLEGQWKCAQFEKAEKLRRRLYHPVRRGLRKTSW